MSTTTVIEKFPAHRLDDAHKALAQSHARLIRAAAKAGQAPPAAPVLTVLVERVFSRCARCRHTVEGFARPAHSCRDHWSTGDDVSWTSLAMVDLALIAERPALAGWVFLAAVEPLEGGNLIRQVPGADVAEGELAPWATGAIACDHCQARRRRAETFVVRADGTDPAIPAGTYKQVGRQCIAAFLGGKSPAAIVAQLGWPDVVRGVGDEDGEGGWGGGGSVQLHDPTLFVIQTAAVIRLDGWRSRARARDDGDGRPSTASHVLGLLTPPFGGDPRGDWQREVARCKPNDEDRERGAAALAWARGLAGHTDYERNLSLVARQTGLRHEHAGILASAVSAYVRVLEREVERTRQADTARACLSAHVGEVGQRLTLAVTVQRVASFDTDYGALHVISLRDAANNLLVWKTGSQNPKPGEKIWIRGSVKSHGEYRGEAQTVLTRCEIRDEEPPAKPARKPRAKKTAKPAKPAAPAWAIGDRVAFDESSRADGHREQIGSVERVEPGERAPIVYVRLDSGQLAGVSPSFLRPTGSIAATIGEGA